MFGSGGSLTLPEGVKGDAVGFREGGESGDWQGVEGVKMFVWDIEVPTLSSSVCSSRSFILFNLDGELPSCSSMEYGRYDCIC